MTLLLSIDQCYLTVYYKEEISFYTNIASGPSAYKVDRNKYFTINMTFAHQMQMNFPEEFISKLTDSEQSFSVSLQDFTDSESNQTVLLKDHNF